MEFVYQFRFEVVSCGLTVFGQAKAPRVDVFLTDRPVASRAAKERMPFAIENKRPGV
jgi:hypothetical protein